MVAIDNSQRTTASSRYEQGRGGDADVAIPNDATAESQSAGHRSLVAVGADLVGLSLSGLISLQALSVLSHSRSNYSSRLWMNLGREAVLFPLVLAVFAMYGLYHRDARRLRPSLFIDLKDILHAMAGAGFLALAIVVLIHRLTGNELLTQSQLAALPITGAIVIPIVRALAARFVEPRLCGPVRIIIVGSGTVAERVAQRLRAQVGLQIVGFVDDTPFGGIDVLGDLANLSNLCERHRIGRVIVAFSETHPAAILDTLRPLHGRVPISLVPRYFELISWRSQPDELYGVTVIDVPAAHFGRLSRMAKRALDVAIATACLVLMSPLLVVVAAVIKFTSPGPILFPQRRIGKRSQPFRMLKFRTMRLDAEATKGQLFPKNEADGPMFKIRDDPRITSVGHFLRRSSIDELPQLINVLLGHMSIVGPRPLVPEESSRIGGWAARRFDVRPGLTGQWQVSGRSELTHDELCWLDYLYVTSWSLLWDLRILWQTPARVLSGYGAY